MVKYKTKCKNAAKIVKNAVTAYEETIISKAKKYPKILHAYIRKKQNVRDQIRAIEEENGEITEDDEKCCNLFNKYFQSVEILNYKSFGAILENECLPTVKLMPETKYEFRKLIHSNLLNFDNKNSERAFLISENIKRH